MFGQFKVIPVESDPEYTIVQPPAGLLRCIQNRLKLYSADGEGESSTLSVNVWAAVFVFSAIHYKGEPLVVQAAKTLLPPSVEFTDSVRQVFERMDDSEFKLLIEEFLFNISSDKLKELFDAVDSSMLVTKKVSDESKND